MPKLIEIIVNMAKEITFYETFYFAIFMNIAKEIMFYETLFLSLNL